MPDSTEEIIETLRDKVHLLRENAFVPYSGSRIAVVFLLSDGSWIPGVRVESASFSLVIPAVLNGYTTGVTLKRTDVEAVVQSEAYSEEDCFFLESILDHSLNQVAPDTFLLQERSELPSITDRLDPFLSSSIGSRGQGIELVREVAKNAFVPESDFHVGCILEDTAGRLIPGVNVEHKDWSRVLCAERNALGTALSYGIRDIRSIYLTCLKDNACTPCGACRQLLAELAPKANLWMDRGTDQPDQTSPEDLLPGFFSGQSLSRNRRT